MSIAAQLYQAKHGGLDDESVKHDIGELFSLVRDHLLDYTNVNKQALIFGKIITVKQHLIGIIDGSDEFEYSDMFDDVLLEIKSYGNKEHLFSLCQSVLFALKSVKRVLFKEGFEPKHLFLHIERLILSPDTHVALEKWAQASIIIDWVSTALYILHDEDLVIPDIVLNDLCMAVSDAGQEYYALAVKLGIVSKQERVKIIDNIVISEESLKEEKALANATLKDLINLK